VKSFIVSKKNLYKLARDVRLGSVLLVGKGEMNTGGLVKESNLANAFEAIIGALYLDRGLLKVQKALLPLLVPQITLMVDNKVDFDNKSQLQEYAQRVFRTRPVYRVIETRGPEHNMVFRISVFINNQLVGTGEGTRKIMAEEHAARDALSRARQIAPAASDGTADQR
jgi:ribonuclease-3